MSYLVLTLVTVMPSPSSWHTSVVGTNSDSLLNLSVLDWVSRHFLHWHALWQGQFFQPHPLTIAYSDVVMPQSVLFALLRPVLGSAGAFNAIELVAWVTALWACHCLMRRFCPNDVAALVGSVGWNFSMVRLTQLDHFQFVSAAPFIPIVLLAALRYLERPTRARGLAVGLSLAGVTLAANYYGLMMFIATGALGTVVALCRCGHSVRKIVLPLALGAAVGAALVVPVWWQYHRLQQNPHFVRAPFAPYSTKPSDLAGVSSFSVTLDDAPLLHTANNPLYPGIAVGVLGVSGVVIALTQHQRRKVELFALLGTGAFMLVLSGGDHSWTLGQDWLRPYHWVSVIVPGFRGIRAPARFAVLLELALAVSAVVALDRVRSRSQVAFRLIAALALVTILIESRVDPPVVRVPDRHEWTAVNDILRDLPRALTVELPLVIEAQGGRDIEAPRMVLARRDGNPRINGYSGYEPPGYERVASIVNRFPATRTVEWLQRHRVRYVIIRTGIVGHTDPRDLEVQEIFQPDLDRSAIARLLTDPPPWVSRARRIGDAILVELRSADGSIGAGPAHAQLR